MIKVLLILCLLFISSVALAGGPKYSYTDPKLNDEVENIYHDIDSVLRGPLGPLTISSVTITSATITSATIPSLTVSTANVTVLNVNGNKAYVLIYSSSVSVGVSSCTASGTTSLLPTNTSITLTPRSATSRIEISATGVINTPSANAASVYATIFRGAQNLASIGSAGTYFCTTDYNAGAGTGYIYAPCAMGPYLDSPN